VHPGRNLAIIMETAARNTRLKQLGYNALDEIQQRQQKLMEEE
jgi:HPr kinase/phosphorylase